MIPQLLGVVSLAVLAGGVVNALADDLPASRRPRLPSYPDGSVRPVWAWLGISAFLLNRRWSRKAGAEQASARARLGLRHPLVEATTAILALMLYLAAKQPVVDAAVSAWTSVAYAALYVLVGVVDIERRRILAATLLPLAALALFDSAFLPDTSPNLASALFGGLSGFLLFYLVFAGGYLFAAASDTIFKRPVQGGAIGFGDVMLAGALGLIIGFPNILLALGISIFAGAVGAVAIIAGHYRSKGSYGGLARMPYGPYMLFGAIVSQLWGNQLAALMPGA